MASPEARCAHAALCAPTRQPSGPSLRRATHRAEKLTSTRRHLHQTAADRPSCFNTLQPTQPISSTEIDLSIRPAAA